MIGSFPKSVAVEKKPRVLSKPLPSQEEVEAQPKQALDVLNAYSSSYRVRSSIKKAKNHSEVEPDVDPEASGDVFDWSESKQGFEQQIESTKQEALKEWEELRKPDEWDMALDQGKTKKTRRNKVANRRAGKSNPFQAAADKRRRKQYRVC